ncbi:hypothetical protein [Marinobacter nauticus]|uniref:hypothetical protein n=1 Tax=Marinobacter nauticus TaxID=2743 RepID=UPI001C99DDE1|nr:hypothetical protein [Marinobacter nauticus]MBY5962088.1 hypothetical protein [Marinobacter nauticus]
MSEQQSRLVITIDAQDSEQQARDTARALQTLDKAGISASASAQKLSKQSKDTADDLNKVDKSSKKTGKSVKELSGFMSTLAGVAAGIGFTSMIKGSINAGAQLDILSEKLDISVETLSRNAYAAQTVGIEVDKLGDIYKDVSDKIGDFVSTGGGQMADFFENIAPLVGVTAKEFENLNSADALQLYISSLEKAGVSQDQMRFYLEAMSDEATALLPLLKDNGRAMRDLGDEAESVGAVLSKDFTEQAREADKEFKRLQASMSALTNDLTIALTPALIDGAQFLRENADTIATVVTGLGALYAGIKAVTAAQIAFNFAVKANPLVKAITLITTAGAAIYTYSQFADDGKESTKKLNEEVNKLRESLDGLSRDQLTSKKATLTAELEAQQVAAQALKDELREIQQTQIKDQSGPANGILGGTSARALADYSANQQRVNEQLKERQAAITQISAKIGVLDKQLEALDANSQRRHQTSQRLTKVEQDALDKRVDSARSMYDKLRQAFNPAGVALDQFDSQVADLNLLLDQGQISLTDYTQGLEQARKEYNEAARAADPYLSRVDELNEKYVKQSEILQALKDKRDAANLTGPNAGIIQTGAGMAVRDAVDAGKPDVQGIDPSIGGAFGEANRLQQEQEQVDLWYTQRIEQLRQFENTKSEISAQAAEERLKLEEERSEVLLQLERQEQMARLQGTADLFGNLANLSATFAGDSAGITRGLILFQKAAAITKSIIAIQAGIAQASDDPFPANIAAMASVVAATSGIVSTISSVAAPNAPTFKASNYAGTFDKGGSISANEWGVISERAPEVVNGALVYGASEVVSSKDTRKMMGGTNITIPVSITVQAQQGMSDDEARKQGRVMGASFEAQIRKTVMDMTRPGGELYDRRF